MNIQQKIAILGLSVRYCIRKGGSDGCMDCVSGMENRPHADDIAGIITAFEIVGVTPKEVDAFMSAKARTQEEGFCEIDRGTQFSRGRVGRCLNTAVFLRAMEELLRTKKVK